MTPAQELRAQRHAVMAGKWVQHTPTRPGEACLVERRTEKALHTLEGWRTRSAFGFVCEALHDLGYEEYADGPRHWNDVATHSQVIEVLDRAIKLADLAEEGGDV